MKAPTTPTEDKWTEMAAGGATKTEKLNALLQDQILKERRTQRKQDVQGDHSIALFTRQKKRGKGVMCLTLLLLTVIHGIQIIALYNFNILSGIILTDSINDYVERAYWWSTNNATIQSENAVERHDAIRGQIGGSESDMLGIMDMFGYCLTYDGYRITLFNLAIGLFFIYLFIFADIWKVMFGTTIVRNFPEDPNFLLSLGGIFWLICLNSAILTWLGVECGYSVVAMSGDFYNVLFNTLSIFIILKLDETVLPLVRFFIEDAGHVDACGELDEERLKLITHGGQYYKPGYGQHWIQTIRTGFLHLKVIAILNMFVALTIVIAPLAVTIDYAVKTLRSC